MLCNCLRSYDRRFPGYVDGVLVARARLLENVTGCFEGNLHLVPLCAHVVVIGGHLPADDFVYALFLLRTGEVFPGLL